MAVLPTNYLDDILAASMGGKRRFRITHEDGSTEEVTLEDVSEYEQVGSPFGSGDVNKTNQAVNEKLDSADVVDPALATVLGFAADAKLTGDALSELNKNFKNTDVEYISGGVTINEGSVKRCGKLISVSVDFTTGSGTTEYSQILKNLPKCATNKIIGVINDYKYDTQSGTFMLYNDYKSAILRINKGLSANTKYHLGFVYLTSDSL